MANKILGITIDIEGKTSGLTKSLQEANSSINKTTSALKDVDKALKLDPTNVELIAQKEALLNKQIEQTSEKLEIMRQVADDANAALERGDISQEQYASLTAEIVRTEQSLAGLEEEANNSADALENSGDAAEDAGDASEDAGEKMEALGEAAQVAGEVAVAAFEAVVVAAAAVGAAVTAAMVEVGTAMVTATVDTAHLADEIMTLSSTTGLATDTLQELNYAAELLDVDTSTVTGSITKMEKVMNSAIDGSSTAQQKFTDLGIAIYDANGNVRDAEDVFWDAIDVLGTFESETERDMAAMDLFGKSAKELNPLIEGGSEAFRQLADEAHEVGYVMSGDTLEAFGELDDNMVRMTNTAQAVEQSFGAVLLPLLTSMSGDVVDLMGDFSGALAGAEGDIDAIASIIEQFAPRAVELVEQYFPQIITVIQSVLNALLPVFISMAPQIISLAGVLIEQLASGIADNADQFLAAFSTLFESLMNSIAILLPVIVPLAVELITQLVTALTENAPLLVDGALTIIGTLVDTLLSPSSVEQLVMSATSIITALLNGLTTALPVLIPAALNAILTLVDTLLSSGCLEQILKAALTLITTFAGALIQYLPELISRLPEIINGITKFLTGDALPDIIEAGFTLITAIITNMPEIISAIVGGLIDLVAGMVEYMLGDGKDDIFDAFQSAFDGIINGAKDWGGDLIQNFIDGISKMFGKLKDTVSNAASIVADFLHFSEPKLGPLSDFNESGADMVKSFISSMESEEADLESALFNTASVISQGWNGSAVAQSAVGTSDNALAGLEQAISSMANMNGATLVFPIYIGSEHVDTFVLDALDRYNYTTGGH